MDYVVALDAGNKVTGPYRTNVEGIPHAFLVDKAGVIQYSGHPMDPNFEAALKKYCVGTAKKDDKKDEKQAKATIDISKMGKDELSALKPKELHEILDAHNIDSRGCLEKSELVNLILEKCKQE